MDASQAHSVRKMIRSIRMMNTVARRTKHVESVRRPPGSAIGVATIKLVTPLGVSTGARSVWIAFPMIAANAKNQKEFNNTFPSET